MPPKATAPSADTAAAPDLPEAASSSPADVQEPVDVGGVFVNAGPVPLTIPFPPREVPPGRIVGLPYTPTHRALRPASAADIAASRAAEQAEQSPPATTPTTTGQEQ